GEGGLLLDVKAVGLSFPDVLQCRGDYQVKPPLPFTPGGETVGIVAEVGPGVEGFVVGERVLGLGGGLAEQVVIPAMMAAAVPDEVSDEKAAALPINYGTTWFALHDRAKLTAGETVLVTGAAGGTGSAAIQLAKAAGARVIAIAGGEVKAQACRDLGADVVIDHRETPKFVESVRAAAGKGGVDVCFDPVGGGVFQHARRTMGWDGRYLIIGFLDGIQEAPANHILLKNYSLVGVHWGASLARDVMSFRNQMASVLALAKTGEVDPLLFPTYGFADAASGLQDLADRKTYGKVVVTR
ncbi:MAG: NADPH:quinone oxidoreductase family protein, partial [Acidimicrobiales bacterium]